MTYAFQHSESVEEGLRRIAAEQLARALDEIADPGLDIHDTVHQVRKRCKKVRALARLVRGSWSGYSDANGAVRDAARRVSDLRDAKVRVDTFDDLVGIAGGAETLDPEALSATRNALVGAREAVVIRHLGEEQRTEALRADLETIHQAVGGWSLDDDSHAGDGFAAVTHGFAKTYRRGRKAMGSAYDEPTPERFHEWRKRAKYHRYQLRLVRPLWPAAVNALRHSLHDLTDLLGVGNDLSVLTRADDALAAGGAEAEEALRRMIAERRDELWRRARGLGEMHYASPADEMVDRLGAVWTSARG